MLRERLPRLRLLLQGEGSKAALISAFRADGNAVLVATMSFWEGVDVPGQALRLVVLEKIPFAVPTDPVMVARSRELEAAGVLYRLPLRHNTRAYALTDRGLALRPIIIALGRWAAERA